MRLILSVILFGLIAWEQYLASFIMFVIAAGTDWLDGYFARKYGQVTTLGRILDPFADKVIVCGTFIFLTAIPAITHMPLGIAAVDGRCDRGAGIAGHGLAKLPGRSRRRFSAKMSGKLKMVLQCVAAGSCLFALSTIRPPGQADAWIWWILVVSLWSAVVLTVYSGVVYMSVAVPLLRQAA